MKRKAEASLDSSKVQEKRNKFNKKSTKVLDIAAYFQSTSEANIITKLQDNSIDLNMIDDKNITLFMYAANKGYFDLFTYLNSNTNVKKDLLTKEEETIIHCAARGGNKDIMYVLLANSSNIDTKDLNGNTPLHLAVYEGHIEVVKLLLADSRVNPEAEDNYAIRGAAYYGQLEVVKLLLADSRVNPEADDNFAIRWGARNGHIEVVRLLLADSKVNPGVYNSEAIRWAAYNGHLEVVRLLLSDSRVNPEADHNYAIREAAANGHLEVVRLLLADSRVNPAADNNYAIREAARNDHIEIIKLLMENKAVTSTIDYNALAKIALDRKHNNLYATLESYNPANKGFLTSWAGRKDLGSLISILPEETIKEEIIRNYFDKKTADSQYDILTF